MTVLAWDGVTLAADRQAACGDCCSTVRKIFRIGDCLAGITGDLTVGMELLEWLKAGAIAVDFRQDWRDLEKGASLLVILPDGAALKYESSPLPFKIESEFAAAGSGCAVALAVMNNGGSAVTAVKAACKYLTSCGMGYDHLLLHPADENCNEGC